MGKNLARAGKVGWQLLSSLTLHGLTRRPPSAAKPGFETLESRELPAGFMQPGYLLFHQAGTVQPFGSSGPSGTTPAQIRHAYGFDTITFKGGTVTGDGTGTTIAIVDAYDDPTAAGDLHQFDAAYGLPDPVFTKVNQTGGGTMPSPNSGWALEIALDVEWAHAIAPKANILLVEANSSSDSDLFTAVQYAASQPGVAVVSMSWGGGEFGFESSWDSTFTTPAGHAGVTFVASSGDAGAPVSYPSASPNVVSVGGTTLSIDGSGNYLGESGWSGSGGGVSAYEPQPSYQNGVVTQTSTKRANPDVAYDGNPSSGFGVYASYVEGASTPWVQVGGTSAGAPQWAALIAIADQGRALAGLGALDGPTQTLPKLYGLTASDFHDITSGGSTGSPNFSAGPGYDLVTGRGTPIANLVVADLVGPTIPGPSAQVYDGSAAIASGTGSDSFGSTVVGTPVSRTFTVKNAGTATLTLGSPLTVPAGFTLTSGFGSTTLASGGTTTFTVQMSATAVGSYSGTVSFATNDPANNPYTFTISGTVTAAGSGSGTFVKADTSTQGSWVGAYGAQGYDVANGSLSLPSYAQVTLSGQLNWTWAASTTDVRALQNGGTRLAATWYSGSSFTVGLNLTDGAQHQLAVYALDWDNQGRSERIDLINATTGMVLDSRTVSSFQGGEYLVWDVSGNVQIKVTSLAGSNAVLSGLFLDPVNAAGPSAQVYDGSTAIASGTGSDSFGSTVVGTPVSRTFTVKNAGTATLTLGSPLTVPAGFTLTSGFGSTTLASGGTTTFTVQMSATAVGSYSGTVSFATNDPANNPYTFTISGTVTAAGSGSGTFVKADTSTQGSWVGAYGAQGYDVANGSLSLPSYAQVTLSGQLNWTWAASTTDVRALQNGGTRLAATWYSGSSFTVGLNLTDGAQHQLAVYALDWDNQGRSERIDLINATTGMVLDSRTVSSFQGGEYLVWDVSGNVQIKVTSLAGSNAVLSGLFLDPVNAAGPSATPVSSPVPMPWQLLLNSPGNAQANQFNDGLWINPELSGGSPSQPLPMGSSQKQTTPNQSQTPSLGQSKPEQFPAGETWQVVMQTLAADSSTLEAGVDELLADLGFSGLKQHD